MTPSELYAALIRVENLTEAEGALTEFASTDGVSWVPVGGKENNRGVIELSASPGRALVERVTNAFDAILELEFERHSGQPDCRSPKEAATSWLNVPPGGLSEATAPERRALAQRVMVRMLPGEGRESRVLEVRDHGIGLGVDEMAHTILSLNESNKIQKHYLAGTYGQGGSATFSVSRYTLIATRKDESSPVGFTIVKFLDLPPDAYKTGHYVYLVLNGQPLEAEAPAGEFPRGTLVKHFGYDLTGYSSPLGPNSVYGLLNNVLFDPVMPVWLDNRVNNYRRVIKGSRNSLNGAVDEGDEERRGPTLSHNMRMFYVSLGEFGRLGIEYWVLSKPSSQNKNPVAAFVNPRKPILLTINGQDQAEMSSVLIRKDSELPYLVTRLICHVNCDSLSPTAKRSLFASTREEARRGMVYSMIEQELVKVLKSDDALKQLNEESRRQGIQERDEDTVRAMRTEVGRLLRLQGMNIVEPIGSEPSTGGTREHPPTHPRTSHPTPQPITLQEPPTFIRILADDGPITFHPEQRRYLRIETDASSAYHDPNDPTRSRINLVSTYGGVRSCGSTQLEGGRLRAIFECSQQAHVGDTGSIRVELSRPGQPVLSDEHDIEIVVTPPSRADRRQIQLPEFEIRAVEGPDATKWLELDWPGDVASIASSTESENDRLVVYYSAVYPPYRAQLDALELRDPTLAQSFRRRYEVWLVVYALLIQRDRESAGQLADQQRIDSEIEEGWERKERCRAATMAAFMAKNEVQSPGFETQSD